MSEKEPSGGPAPMEGRGGYNRSSAVQASGLSPAVPLFEQAARIVPLPDHPETIAVADYGSSEGRNSLGPMLAARRALRDRAGPFRAISIVHTDLPGNDFSALFRTLEADPDSYLRGDANTFASAVGRSFYKQILPLCSVTLGWSSWAVQWLSQTPGPIPDQLEVAFSADKGVQAAYAAQAAEDWRVFLMCRSLELMPGARLAVVTMATRDNGDFGYGGVMNAMYGAFLELASEGVINKEEARRMVIPTVGRSRAELAAPFSAEGRFAGLSIEHLDVFDGKDSIWEDFERDRDAGKFGARWAAFSRASVFPTLALGLDGGPGDPRGPAFSRKLEAGMAARLAANPERTVMPLAAIVLVKDTS